MTGLRLIAGFHLIFIVTATELLFAYTIMDPGATVLMLDRKYLDGWKIAPVRKISYAAIPRIYRRMLVSVEDGGFYDHSGVDLSAIKQAYEIDKRIGKPLYGGSTLTMQLSRTLFLIPSKSYVRKYLEIIIALAMDLILSKERQLELYFNYAEWGKGLFGVEAASYRYFKTSFRNLGPEPAVRLFTLLSSPILYTPDTLWKSRILAARYEYLSLKYLAPPPEPVLPPPDEPALPDDVKPDTKGTIIESHG